MQKKSILFGSALLALSVLGFFAVNSNQPIPSSDTHPVFAAAAVSEMNPIESTTPDVVSSNSQYVDKKDSENSDEIQNLSLYLQDLMLQWSPAKNMPQKDVSHYPSIATDIATVVLDQKEKPLFTDDPQKWRSAVLMTAIGFWEGHFWKHVDDGRCNNFEWRMTREGRDLLNRTGNCDGGLAWTIFQIHPEGGIELTADGGWTHHYKKVGDPVSADGPDMVTDRKIGVRTSLHMIRASLRMGGGLCAYTGEPGPCPKARQRLDFTYQWISKHPYSKWIESHRHVNSNQIK